MSEMDGLGVIALFTGAMLFFILLIALACYVISAIWEMKFLQKVGYDKVWFAWIPFANWYALADVAFSADIQEVEMNLFKKPAPLWVFKFFTLLLAGASIILNVIPIIKSLSFILNIFVYLAFLPPILKAIARKFNTTITDGRTILDSIITIVAMYDVYAFSKNNQFNPYADISDIVGSKQFDYSGFEQGMPTNEPQSFDNYTPVDNVTPTVNQNSDFVSELQAEESEGLPKEFQ